MLLHSHSNKAWLFRSQVQQFEEEHTRLPVVVGIKGATTPLFLPRLVAFTGTRFLRSVADSATIDFGDGEDAAGMPLLFEMLAGKAPKEVSVETVATLLRACHFALAERLLDGLSEYLAPGMPQLCAANVRLRRFVSCRRFGRFCAAALADFVTPLWYILPPLWRTSRRMQ